MRRTTGSCPTSCSRPARSRCPTRHGGRDTATPIPSRDGARVSDRTGRVVAIRALVRVEHGAFANVALPSVLRDTGLPARERAQVTDWVYGTLRRQRTLDHLLSPVLDRR